MELRLNLHLARRTMCRFRYCEVVKGAGIVLITLSKKFVFLTTVAAVEVQSKRSRKGRNEGLHAPGQCLSMQYMDLFIELRMLIYPVVACVSVTAGARTPFRTASIRFRGSYIHTYIYVYYYIRPEFRI